MSDRAKLVVVGLIASIGLYCAALSANSFREPLDLGITAVADTWLPTVTPNAEAAAGSQSEGLGPAAKPEAEADSWEKHKAALRSCGEAPPETSIAFVGDVMLSRAVMAQIKAGSGDWREPFAGFADWLASADITVGNLETAVTDGRRVGLTEMVFRADPEAATALADVGFDVVSLANNHTPNFGQAGLANTFRHLNEAGVRYVGAGPDDFAAWQPVYVQKNGLVFGFVAVNDGDVVPSHYAAAPGRAGTAVANEERLQNAVSEARLAADVVVLLLHSGSEYSPRPNGRQTVWAKAAIDAGADLVIGHHPHVVQTLEYYKDRPIIYSLGNFVFDQTWSQMTRDGLGVRAVFRGATLSRLELEPLIINSDYYPVRADEESARRVLARLSQRLETDTVMRLADQPKLDGLSAGSVVFESGLGCARSLRRRRIGDAEIILSGGTLSVQRGSKMLWATSPEVWVESVAPIGDQGTALLSFWRSDEVGKPRQRLAELTLSGPDVFWAELRDLEAPLCDMDSVRLSDGRAAVLALVGEYRDWPGCLGRIPQLLVSDGFGWRTGGTGPVATYDGFSVYAWGDETLARLHGAF